MLKKVFARLLATWARKEWAANIADPTQVVQWQSPQQRVTLIDTLGCVQATVRLGRWSWTSVNNRLFVKLCSGLELAWAEDQFGDGDFESCPTCGNRPGDGRGCNDPEGCGFGAHPDDVDSAEFSNYQE